MDNKNHHKLIDNKDGNRIKSDVGHPNLPRKCSVRQSHYINSKKNYIGWEHTKKWSLGMRKTQTPPRNKDLMSTQSYDSK